MSAEPSMQESPEWAQARNDWRAQADDSINGLHSALKDAAPGTVARETIYAPIHDLAGLAPVFEYHLLGNTARALMEILRNGVEHLDQRMLDISRAYVTTLSALHAKDVRGPVGAEGEAELARLASLTA